MQSQVDQSLSDTRREDVDPISNTETGGGSLLTEQRNTDISPTSPTNPTFAGGTVGGDRPGTFGRESSDGSDETTEDEDDNREPPICRA